MQNVIFHCLKVNRKQWLAFDLQISSIKKNSREFFLILLIFSLFEN